MHEAAGERLGLRYTYTLIDTARFDPVEIEVSDIVRAARICGFAGLNITYPHKQTIITLLDTLSDDAAQIGAVNTVTFVDDQTIGHNTDKFGFAEAFRREMQGAGVARVLQLGAGGAGAAVASALAELGAAEVFITDLDAARAQSLVQRLQPASPGTNFSSVAVTELAALQLDGVVNTTPVGMAPTPGLPIDPALLSPTIWVADIIYFPLETALLRAARAAGCRTMSGAPMAIYQAVKAFELFTGRVPDETEMKATFDAFETDAISGH